MEAHTRRFKAVDFEKGFKFHPLSKYLGMTNFCFANDSVSFCKAEKNFVKKLMDVFNNFSKAIGGLSANLQKSQMFIGEVSHNYLKSKFLNMSGFELGEFRYEIFSNPVVPTEWSNIDCQTVVNKIAARI
ncbi:hypothetical protein RIF29_04683 [Crotalaria pallida]|uniref:Uncharacterized protein n=1 Tax=Crotalaria pallida TaxID=3830 RepID=A0AAN9P9D3_CROPI